MPSGAVVVRVARTAPRVYGRTRRRVRTLVDTVRNVVSIRIERTAALIDERAGRRVGTSILAVGHAVVVRVASRRAAEGDLEPGVVEEIVDVVISGRIRNRGIVAE
jgi:hypothetical protein